MLEPFHVLGGLILTALGTALGFILKRRLNTGDVRTSSAQDLWAESSQMRQALRDENTLLRAENAALKAELAERPARAR